MQAYTLLDWGLLAAIALIWGSSFLFMEIGLRSFEPGVISLARIGLGAATLALFSRARAAVEREDWPRIAVLGVVWMAIPLLIFPIAQQWINSSVTGMINGAMPVFTVLWATYLMRLLPGWRQLLGIGLGFVGMLLVFVPELRGRVAISSSARCWWSWRWPSTASRPTSRCRSHRSTAPCRSSSGRSWWRCVIVAPIGLLQIPASSWSWESALAMVPVGVLGTGAAFALMATLTGRVGGPRASVAIYFLPVVAIVLGVVILGESVAPVALVGVLVVMAGAWIASRRES